jgi:hypothetical protein
MGIRVHKVKPLDNEGKKKVLSNMVIGGDGFQGRDVTFGRPCYGQTSYCGKGAISQTTTSYSFGNSTPTIKEVFCLTDLG